MHTRDRSFINTSTTYCSPEDKKNCVNYHKYTEDTIDFDNHCHRGVYDTNGKGKVNGIEPEGVRLNSQEEEADTTGSLLSS